jgi:hypothetical protein
MTVAIRIAGIAHTPLATHPRVASPPTTARAPRAGGGSYPATADAVVVPDPGSRFIRTRDAQRSRDSVILAALLHHISASSCFPRHIMFLEGA